ncbi:hypothetical protein I308_104689 [Cryptococcus tetragattii IND107]|uniref:Uncharacterized protein n=1 Tax=Cryptococcus tetragattii IND107 TaxID=1296105 RepID=A0ABR3BNB0_9TREE
MLVKGSLLDQGASATPSSFFINRFSTSNPRKKTSTRSTGNLNHPINNHACPEPLSIESAPESSLSTRAELVDHLRHVGTFLPPFDH